MNQEPKTRNGFTLMELLVAMAVFSSMIVAIGGIFTSVVGSQRKNIYNQEILDNARFVLENIGRAIRQSTITTPNGTSATLTITHPVKNVLTYELAGGSITEKSSLDSAPVALTSNKVAVDSLIFVVAGNSMSDGLQPRVTIAMTIRSEDQRAELSTSINLQTTVSPRKLQIQQ